MDFVVAIPSYKRQEKLKTQTLPFLASESVPVDKIFVFVASEEERNLYAQTLEPGTYGHLIVGVPVLSNQLEFIKNFFPHDQNILRIDDDIKGLKWLRKRPLIRFVNEMFKIAREEKINIWSIQPATTTFFCRERISIGKLFCVGCFCGLINTKDFSYPDISACEDKWLSLTRYLKDGATMLYEGCCPNTTYFAKGGLSEYRKTRQVEDTQTVCQMFPDDCVFTTKKRTGVAECYWRQIRFSARERQLPF